MTLADLRAAAVGSAIARYYERPCDLEAWLRGAADFNEEGQTVTQPNIAFRATLAPPKIAAGSIGLSLVAKIPEPPAPPVKPLLLKWADGDSVSQSMDGYWSVQRQYSEAVLESGGEVEAEFQAWAGEDYTIDLEQRPGEKDADFTKRIDGYKTRHQSEITKATKFKADVAKAREAYGDQLAAHEDVIAAMRDRYLAYGSLAQMGALVSGQEFEVTLTPVHAPSNGQIPGMTAALLLAGAPASIPSTTASRPAARLPAATTKTPRQRKA